MTSSNRLKSVVSIEGQPYFYKGCEQWYKAGTEFEVVEEKELKLVGLCYKLKIQGFILDGWNVAKFFKKASPPTDKLVGGEARGLYERLEEGKGIRLVPESEIIAMLQTNEGSE